MAAARNPSLIFLSVLILGGLAYWYYANQQARYDMLYVHGLFDRGRDVSRSANWYKKNLFGKDSDLRLALFNFAEISRGLLASPLGQGADIDKLVAFQKKYPHLGVLSECRGSSSVLFALAREKWVLPFAILNAPLVSIRSLAYYQIKRHGLSSTFMFDLAPMIPAASERAFRKMFPYHKLNGVQPIDVVDQIPLGTPFLLIVSKDDTTITPNDTRHLYIRLKELGHEVYIYEAKGEHCRGIKPNIDPDCRKVVNAFLAHVGAPHNKELSVEGNKLFAQCQPRIKEVRKRMRKDPKFYNKPFKTSKKSLLMLGGAIGLGVAAHSFSTSSLGSLLLAGIVGHQLILPAILFIGGRIAVRIIRGQGK